MIDFKNIKFCDLQKYIGKEIFILHPGFGDDYLNGTIDSEPPHLLTRTIKGFYVSGIEMCVITNSGNFNVKQWKIYFDEKEGQIEVEKLFN